jgi:hypothetical protein
MSPPTDAAVLLSTLFINTLDPPLVCDTNFDTHTEQQVKL